ncbi:GNAT family N-acetyltransferase [Hypericibacter sp.]|uniref:GNAT family N-acetyltransferase n=1 Tax=Hypericibacter sp. TaxID=2705401 RepID=UPI003D6D2167
MPDCAFTRIETERLALRRFQARDLPDLAAYRAHPDVLPWQGWSSFGPADAAALIAEMAWLDPDWPGRWFQIGIALKDRGRLIGDIGLFAPAADPAGARIGYTLAPDWQGQGLAREAVAGLIAYLFAARAKRRVVAGTLPGNAPSQRLLMALGFRRLPSLDLDGEWGFVLERPAASKAG